MTCGNPPTAGRGSAPRAWVSLTYLLGPSTFNLSKKKGVGNETPYNIGHDVAYMFVCHVFVMPPARTVLRPFPLFSRQCCIRLVAVSRRRAGNDGGMVLPGRGRRGRRYEIIPGGDTSRGGSEFNTVLKVAPGSYRVICHNGETENNLEDGDTFFSYRIHTGDDVLLSPMNRSDNAPCPDGCDTQPVKTEASTLYAHTYPSVVSVAASADSRGGEVCAGRGDMRMECNNHRDRESCARSRGKRRCHRGRRVLEPCRRGRVREGCHGSFPLSQYGGDCLKGKVTLLE